MNGVSTGLASAGQIKKPGSIGMNLGELDNAIEELTKTVAQHESRINPILTPVPPRNEDSKLEEGSPTDLGRALVNFRNKVHAITQHVRTMDSRIEL